MTIRPAVAAAFLIGAAACSSDPALVGAPAPIDPSRPEATPRPGGGVSEAVRTDRLIVFAVDERGAALSNADITVNVGEVVLAGRTDEEGRIDFVGSEVTEPKLDVHASLEGRGGETLADVESEVVTLVLPRLGEPIEPPAPAGVAAVRGTVTGWERMPAPTSERVRVAELIAVGDEPLDFLVQPPRPGTATPDDPDGLPEHLALDGVDPFPTFHDFGLTTDARAIGLVAYGWVFDALTGQRRDAVLGMRMGLSLESDAEIEGIDVELTHPLEIPVDVVLPATDLSVSDVWLGLALDPEARRLVPLFRGALDAGNRAQTRGPLLEGDLSEARYRAEVRLTSTESVGSAPAREMWAARAARTPDFDLRDVVSPPSAPSLRGDVVAVTLPAGATTGAVTLGDETGVLWTVSLMDPERREVTLPSGFANALPPGSIMLDAAAYAFEGSELRSAAHHRTEARR